VALALLAAIFFRWSAADGRTYSIGWQISAPYQLAGGSEPTGMAVEVVREAARRRRIKLHWVRWMNSSESALQTKRVDLWPLITITPQRLKKFHITEPYVETEYSLLVRANSSFQSLEQLAAGNISLTNISIDGMLLGRLLPAAHVISRNTPRAAIEDVCLDRADAAFMDVYTAIATLLDERNCDGAPLRWIAVPSAKTQLGIGATPAGRAAADELRDEIGNMARDGALAPIIGKWGFTPSLNLISMEALVDARRRVERLIALTILFALLTALACWQTIRAVRERNRTRRTQQALREADRKLRLMTNNLKEMVVAFSLDRKLSYANPAMETLTGYAVAEYTERGFIDWIHPDDRFRMLGRWDGLFRGESYQNEEYRMVTKGGAVKWISATWGPIRDEAGRQVGVQGTERDISERKVAEEALRESERRFRGLLESVHLSAIMVDLDGTLTFVNDYVMAATGYSREELVGHQVTDFMPAQDRVRVTGLIQSVKEEKSPAYWTADAAIVAKSGKLVQFRASTLVLRDGLGKPVGMANIGADVTEQRALQEQYLQAQKMEGLGRLAGGVAHDFNNLLTVINGYSEIIFRKLQEADPLRGNADQIRKAGARAADLTRQLLTFSRKHVSRPRPLDLNAVVSESQGMWGRLLSEEIELIIRLHPALHQVMADDGQIHQVLMNLVVNARDAMPQGGTLLIETSNLEIDSSYVASNREAAEGPHVLLAVSDTGVGMDEETRLRIFEPFFTTKPVGEGSGLGLATVFGIVKQSQGWIDVGTQVGNGSIFKVYLPRLQSAGSAPDSVEPARAASRCTETVLLVEDQDEVRGLATSILEEEGYRVLSAARADTALQLADTFSETIHLLLTDVVLPGMSSRELAERLMAARPGIRVLFTSGYTREAAALRMISDRGAAFLPKPYLPEAIVAKVRELLDRPASG
jgi:PAS domain S-box-containing protein